MAISTTHAFDIPSGKDVAYENFPVGSWLLPARLRPHIAFFYHFARAADDIADNPDLPAEEKIIRLNAFEDALRGKIADNLALSTAHRMRESLECSGVTMEHCVKLLAAFKQDATKLRYGDWDELIGYCDLSAAPVGRYLLDLHGGSRDGYTASDALCNALQIINHLQDCGDDYINLERVYLPLEYFADSGGRVEDLGSSSSNTALRRVYDRTIEGIEQLLVVAHDLPGGLKSRRLAMESSAIMFIAKRLAGHLRRRDPLARRVALTKAEYFGCCARGAFASLI